MNPTVSVSSTFWFVGNFSRRVVGSSVANNLSSARTAAPVISAEEQAVLIELNREANKTADPMAPPFPPSLLTEELNAANQADQAPNTTGNNQGSTKPGVAVPSLPIPGRGGLSFPGLP